MATDRYWATLRGDDLAQEMTQRIDDYYDSIKENGRLDLWRRAEQVYYGLDDEGTWGRSCAVSFGGEQGEQVLLHVNHFHSLLQHLHSIVTGSRPSLRARAAKNTSQSTEQTIRADQLLEWRMKRGHLEDALKWTARLALRAAEGWLVLTWDNAKGREYGADPETGQIVYEGDSKVEVCHPIDVIRDPEARMGPDAQLPWTIVRTVVNRWEMAAQYPDHADVFRDLPPVSTDLEERALWASRQVKGDHDFAHVYRLFHEKTPALPGGRYALLAGDKIILAPELPYQASPVIGCIPEVEEGTCFGYSAAWDLLGPQQLLNSIVSAAYSNHDAHGHQNVWTPLGEPLTVDELSGGHKHWQSNTKPESILLLQISEHTYKLYDLTRREMETLIGVNSVARGDPQASLKSGAALALVQSMAVQHNSAFQAAYARLCERAGTAQIQVDQAFVQNKRPAELSGDGMTAVTEEWTGADIEEVSGVYVELGNPLAQTAEGRKQLAEMFLEKGLVKTPEQFAMVVATGRAEPVYRQDREELRMVAAENSQLRKGQHVQVSDLERHDMHIREHSPVLYSPEAKDDDAIKAATIAHIGMHEDRLLALASTQPHLLEIMGVNIASMPTIQARIEQGLAQQMGPPPGAPGPEGAPPPGPPAPEGPGGPPPAEAPIPAVQQSPVPGGSAAQMPQMPVNPATGERVATPTALPQGG
jgi:hypothetical protein